LSTCARCGKEFGFFSTKFNSETVYDMEFHYKLTLNAKYPSNPYGKKNLCGKCYKAVYENSDLPEAENLVRAGRYEDAAKKYEELGMWDKAGDCRRMAKPSYDEKIVAKEIIKEKQVIVKMRCQYCKNLYEETLDKCPYCGARA
jgi:DNA-directed RNA polymerase subunit RPC12/RpoP